MQYRTHPIALPPVSVCLFSYGFDWKKVRSYTAPLTRLGTGKRFNHGEWLIEKDGVFYLYGSAEKGCKRIPAELIGEGLDRYKARIEIRPYIGTKSKEELITFLEGELNKKYDHPAFAFQIIYRFTGFFAWAINNFLGRRVVSGWWIGSKGEKSRRRHGCFEYIFHSLGLPNAYLASGWEFEKLKDFDHAQPVFSELK